MSEGGRGSNLLQRVAVGVVAVPGIVGLAWLGGWAFFALVAVVVVLGLVEFYGMARAKEMGPLTGPGVAGGVLLCLAAQLGQMETGLMLVTGLVLVWTLLARGRGETLATAGVTLLGLLWVGWMGSHLLLLRQLPGAAAGRGDPGARYVWLVLALTWAGDTAAYLCGSLWGRHRLLERVSPRKSVEGALGGLAGAAAMGWLARAWFAPFLGAADVWGLGLGVGIVSQAGDLVESMFKRDAGVKDASGVIPGHGGVLDRFDSLFFSAPFVFLYLRFFVPV